MQMSKKQYQALAIAVNAGLELCYGRHDNIIELADDITSCAGDTVRGKLILSLTLVRYLLKEVEVC